MKLVSGKDLIAADSNGKSDPYVHLKIGKTKHTSKIIKKTLNPEWDQEFDFLIFKDTPRKLNLKVITKFQTYC